MPMLFRICRVGSSNRWRVLLNEQTYGEYLDKKEAVVDAIEAATEARDAAHAAEVWEGAARVY